MNNAKGTSVLRTGSPRVRHGLAEFTNGTLAETISEVQISWQAQHLGTLKCRFRGRGSTFAAVQMSWQALGGADGADLLAGAKLWDFRSYGSNIATSKYESSTAEEKREEKKRQEKRREEKRREERRKKKEDIGEEKRREEMRRKEKREEKREEKI